MKSFSAGPRQHTPSGHQSPAFLKGVSMLNRLLAAIVASLCVAVHAQPAWPDAKPITLVVPFSAGGNVDTVARLVGQKLGAQLRQAVVVENVAGAGGTIGVAKVVRAAPDGYTLVMAFDGPIGIAKLISPATVRYEASKDLVPIGLVSTAPMVLVARPGLAANNLDELVRLASLEQGRLSYATSGLGTVMHLTMESIKDIRKFDATHVPYRGGTQIANDVIGNQVDLAMLTSVTAMPFVHAGKIKAIAVSGDKRLATLPDVPALGELPGFKGLDIVSWTGLFAPAGTDPATVARLNRELNEVLKSDQIRKTLADGGSLPGAGTTGTFAAFVQRENEKYRRIVETAKIKE
jgi:tripartite-type tricarboxylate transporter receptor subunit TctC